MQVGQRLGQGLELLNACVICFVAVNSNYHMYQGYISHREESRTFQLKPDPI